MRIALIVPPLRDFYFTPHRFSCLGAETVRRVLTGLGHRVIYHSFLKGNPPKRTIPLPPYLQYLRPYVDSAEFGPAAFFSSLFHFGPSYRECADLVLSDKPDLLLISCFAFCYADDTIKFAEHVRERFQGPIAFGGAGVSVFPAYFFTRTCADYLLIGEAEKTLRPFLGFLRGKSDCPPPGVITPTMPAGNKLVHPPSGPPLTRSTELFPVSAVTHGGGGKVFLCTHLSRGCPFACDFCSNHLCHGREFRICSFSDAEEHLVSEFRKLTYTGVSEITLNFEDDNILLQRDRFFDLLKNLKKRVPGISFAAENGLDYRLLQPGDLTCLAKLGLYKCNLTFGAGPLTSLGRKTDTEKFLDCAEEASASGMQVEAYYICGYPGDSVDNVITTLLLLHNLPLRTGISLFYPVPGLPGFKDPALFPPGESLRTAGAAAYPWGNSLSTAQLVTAFRCTRLSNFINRGPRNSREAHLLEEIHKQKKISTFRRKRGEVEIDVPTGIDSEMEKAILTESFFRSRM